MSDALLHVRVTAKRLEAHDVYSFELRALDGRELPAFTSGAHIDVHMPNGLIRQYSLCGTPRVKDSYLVAVLRESASRGGSRYMHESAHEGTVLRVSQPRNNFPLAKHAEHSILIAGGIGVTPILCMAEELSSCAASFEMHYCARSAERMAFRHRLEHCKFADQVNLHLDNGAPEQRFDLESVLAKSIRDTHIYVCGPTGLIQWVLGFAREAGWPEHQLHREFFSAEPVEADSNVGFEVEIASSGKVVRVEADQTVVSALAAAGIEVQTSCEQGICGTCVTRVLEGTPDHRDMFLTDEEKNGGKLFTPCCSRAKSSRLVLDL